MWTENITNPLGSALGLPQSRRRRFEVVHLAARTDKKIGLHHNPKRERGIFGKNCRERKFASSEDNGPAVKKRLSYPKVTQPFCVFCAGKYQSDYFPLAAGFLATGAFAGLAAPVLALVDLAAPVFAFVDLGAAGFAAAVFAFVDFAAVDFAAVLFAAIPIFLREDSLTPMKFAGCSPVSGTNNREYFQVAVGPKKTHL